MCLTPLDPGATSHVLPGPHRPLSPNADNEADSAGARLGCPPLALAPDRQSRPRPSKAKRMRAAPLLLSARHLLAKLSWPNEPPPGFLLLPRLDPLPDRPRAYLMGPYGSDLSIPRRLPRARAWGGSLTSLAGVAQPAELLFCKQGVRGSSPLASSGLKSFGVRTTEARMAADNENERDSWEGCPSGQREQTVNLPAIAYVGSNPTPSTRSLAPEFLGLHQREEEFLTRGGNSSI